MAFKRWPGEPNLKARRKRLGGLLTALLLAPLCSWAQAEVPRTAAPEVQARTALGDPLAPQPDLAARFRVSFSAEGKPPQSQTWQLNRSATEIAWIKGHGNGIGGTGKGIEEIWRRDRSGIRLERVLRADRHCVTYSAGELRTLGVNLAWRDLGSLFSEADLAQLKRIPPRPGSQSRLPGAAEHYRGSLANEQVDLVWDPVARLPVHLIRQSETGRVVYQRLAAWPDAPADWPSPGAGTADFQRLDAADFGDMDYHPVVRQEQARDERAGWRKPHAH